VRCNEEDVPPSLLDINPGNASLSSSFTLGLVGFAGTLMYQTSTYTGPEAPLLTNEIIGWLIRYESDLAEVKRDLSGMNRKIDQLLSLSIVGHISGFSQPIDPDQVHTQNSPASLEEFNALGTYLTLKCSPANQSAPLGVFEEGYPPDPDFNLQDPAPTSGNLYTVHHNDSR